MEAILSNSATTLEQLMNVILVLSEKHGQYELVLLQESSENEIKRVVQMKSNK